jgi:hypothetical protein
MKFIIALCLIAVASAAPEPTRFDWFTTTLLQFETQMTGPPQMMTVEMSTDYDAEMEYLHIEWMLPDASITEMYQITHFKEGKRYQNITQSKYPSIIGCKTYHSGDQPPQKYDNVTFLGQFDVKDYGTVNKFSMNTHDPTQGVMDVTIYTAIDTGYYLASMTGMADQGMLVTSTFQDFDVSKPPASTFVIPSSWHCEPATDIDEPVSLRL